NMGAWSFADPHIEWALTKIGGQHTRARYVGRSAAASTATGLASRHNAELNRFLEEALSI
ncbi:MAG TPA: hypothetical protein DIT40_02425, partial [Alphaproteobacteria bacterium]|nr:hypothetical protein [Alphaproteobacteria bacterium]